MINFINIDQTQTFLQEVSEPLQKSNELDFINTLLFQNGQKIDKTSSVFYSYIEKSLKYFIFIVPKNCLPKACLFNIFYRDNKLDKNNTDLFITNDFFCIYIDGEMIFFKSKENSAYDEDIIKYCELLIKDKIDNVFTISDEKVHELELLYKENKKILALPRTITKSYGKLMTIVSFTIMVCFIAVYTILNNKLPIEQINIQEQQKQITKSKLPKIKAMVDNEVFIKNQWYKINGKVNGYTIKTITKEFVVFTKDSKEYKVKLLND